MLFRSVPRNDELSRLPAFLEFAQEAGVDAFILTDLGVFDMAKRYAPKVERHISTQAGVANWAAARMFYEMGASRVVLARELSMEEIGEIRAKTPPELELEAIFVNIFFNIFKNALLFLPIRHRKLCGSGRCGSCLLYTSPIFCIL